MATFPLTTVLNLSNQVSRMPIAGTSAPKFSQYAFTVDFGSGPVAVQKCGEIYATRDRMRLTIERGLSACRIFADLYATETARAASRYAVMAPHSLPVSVVQMNRSRETVVTYNLSDAHVVEYSAGPWDNELSEFTMERLVFQYTGFDPVDTPESKAPNA